MGKLSSYPTKSAPVSTDLVPIIDSVGGNANKVTPYSSFIAALSGLTARVVVTDASQLDGSTTPLLSNVQYFIDGEVDMGDTQILVPAGGLHISGFGYGVSKITTSEPSQALFSGTGSVIIDGVSIEVTGAGASVFSLDNSGDGTGSVYLNGVKFNSCVSIGDLDGYSSLIMSMCNISGCTTGLTLSGTWSGSVLIYKTTVSGTTGTVFGQGTSLVISQVFASDAVISVGDGVTAYSFVEGNFTRDAGFQLIGGNLSGTGTYVNGISSSSSKVKFRDTGGLVQNTPGIMWLADGGEVTAIAEVSAAVIASAPGTVSHSVWFDNGNANDAEYDSDQPVKVSAIFTGSISTTASNNIQIKLVKWDASGSSYSDIGVSVVTADSAGSIDNVIVNGVADLDDGDRVEVWVANNTGTNPVTINRDSSLIISEK